VLGNVNTLIGQRASEKKLELKFSVADDVPQGLLGDPPRVSQILTNLISNAVKFTEQGHIQVSISRLDESDGRVCLEIAVADTGIGMTPKQSARLFSAFSQTDGSTTRRYGGTGLGLTIVKRLAEMMDGDVKVESQAGIGSTFRSPRHSRRPAHAVVLQDPEISIRRPRGEEHEQVVITRIEGRVVLVALDAVAELTGDTAARSAGCAGSASHANRRRPP
jgi:light-regulated signal transduction histidine kinase (bacteriophytochrome)